MGRKVKCPTCRKETEWEDNAHRPFCSERCRLIDLGKWASNRYVVSTPIFDPDEPEQPGQPGYDHEEKPDGGADSGRTDRRPN